MKQLMRNVLFALLIGLTGQLSAEISVQIGFGSTGNSASSFPTPYGTSLRNFRLQYLVLASELSFAGGGAGAITGIGFEVINLNNCSAMQGYRIRMAHTGLNALSSTFVTTGFTEVFYQDSFTPVHGWNQHSYQNPFIWNGSSNVIVEVITNFISGDLSNNASVYYHTTPSATSVYKWSSTIPADSLLTGTTTTYRSNLKLLVQAGTYSQPPNPAVLNFPENQATWFTDPILRWQSGGGVVASYDLYLGTENPPPFLLSTNEANYSANLAPGTTYYWKVEPRNQYGVSSSSEIRSFRTAAADELTESFEGELFPPPAWLPVQSYQRDSTYYFHDVLAASATTSSHPAIFSTPLLNIQNSDSFECRITASQNSVNQVFQLLSSTDRINWQAVGTSWTVTVYPAFRYVKQELLGLNGQYYLGIGVSSLQGSASVSIDAVFGPQLAAVAPLPVEPYSPVSGMVGVPQTPVLKWRPAPDGGVPSSYAVYLDENPQPQTLIGTTTDCHMELNLPLEQGMRYYWKVIAHNQHGASLASEYSWFKVGDPSVISSFPWQEDFGTQAFSDFPLPNWEMKRGALTDNTTLVSGGNWNYQKWMLGSAQANLAASIRTGFSNTYDWLLSPGIDLSNGNYELEFDLALGAEYNFGAHLPTGLAERFAVLIGSGDAWANANVLRMWDNQGSANVYEQISCTGVRIRINLAGYTGINKLAFYSTSFSDNNNGYLMIDNIAIRQIPETPICSITPQNWQFDTVNQGTIRSQTFTVHNIGAEPLNVSTIAINGSEIFVLQDLPALPLSLAVGESFVFKVQFAPWDELYHVGTIEISDNRMMHIVHLDGRGRNGTLSTLPYSENWDALPNYAFHPNWQRYASSGNPENAICTDLAVQASYPNSLRFYASSLRDSTMILSSPYLHPSLAVNTIRLSFQLRGFSSDILELGTISDPFNPSTFNPLASYPGGSQWQSYAFDFSSYSGTDRFIAFRAQSASSYYTGYLDDIVFAAMPACDLKAVSLTGNNTPTAGMPNSYQVLVQNSGSTAQTDYTLKLYNAEAVLLAQAAGLPLAAGAQMLINIDWTPQDVGTALLRAYLDLATDEDVSNNYSAYLPIEVLPQGEISVTIGSGNELGRIPVHFAYQSNLAQTLFYPDEIGHTGSITRLTLYNNFQSSVLNAPLSIWMGSTDLPDLSSGFIGAQELWEVFSGNVNFPAGGNTIQITLDNPYPYTGENLVLMVFRPQDTQTYSGENMFKCQTLGSNRTRNYGTSLYPIDVYCPPKGSGTGQFPQVSFLFSPIVSGTDLLIQPTELNFGNCYVHTSQTKNLKLLNRGSQPWQVNSLVLAGDDAFTLSALPSLPQSLELGETLSVTAVYAPLTSGNHSAILTFTDSQGGRSQFTIPISASALDASISALPYSQDFDAVTMPNLPNGFGKLVQSNGSNASVTTSIYNTPYSDTNCISLRDNPTNTSSTVMLLLPPVTDSVSIRELRISFWAKFVNNATSIKVGATSSLSDPSAFVSLATFALTYEWKEYTATIAAYQGSGRQIALALDNIAAVQYACVDNIVVEYLAAHDLAAVALSGNQTPVSGTEEFYGVSVFNWGSMLQDNYQVKLCNLAGAELASAAGLPVAGGQTVVVPVPLAFLNTSPMSIYGKVVLAMDADVANNESPLLSIFPTPLDAITITVGAGNQLERIPLDMDYKGSLFETIYTADELSNQSGSIAGICFYNRFTSNLWQKPTQIWLGTTDLNNLADGWIPASQLYQVYNSLVDYPSGQNVIAINFPIPFPYNGSQNLVMMVMRPLDTNYYSSSDAFLSQTVGSNRSRKVQSDSAIYNPEFPPQASTLNGRFPKTTFIMVPDALGTIAGTVSNADGNLLVGAQIDILNTECTAISDDSGYFSFANLPVGIYHLACTNHGFYSADFEVVLTLNEQETLSITLNPLPVVNVSGRVIDGESGVIVGSALISLAGYQDYQAEMPAQGLFVIDGVFANQNYSYQISAPGYTQLMGIIEIGSEDYLWPDLALVELPLPPCNLQATIVEAPVAVLLTWELSDSLATAKQNGLSRRRNKQRALSGYLVWRMNIEMQNLPQNWVSLTPQPVLQNSFTDYQWPEIDPGNWLWAVQAQYSGGAVSQYAFSNPLIKETVMSALVGVVQGAGTATIAGALVETDSGRVLTNEQGAYYLPLPAGSYSVSVRAVGFYPLTYDNVALLPWQNTRLDFHLNPVANVEYPLPIPETCLLGIFPNPFAGSTSIAYSQKSPLPVSLDIYNLKGQLVQRLQPGDKSPGVHTVQFFAKDNKGRRLPQGVYFCRMQAGTYHHTCKILLME